MCPIPAHDVITRHPNNPLISLDDLRFRCNDIWNAGVVRVDDQYVLLITIETLEGKYAIYKARAADAAEFAVDAEPFMAPLADGPAAVHESIGIRDARITPMDGVYYIAYTASGDHGLRVGLARTEDFSSVERIAYVSQVDVKNGAMFPAKVRGRYAILKRPNAGASIWLSYSDDLVYWGSDVAVMTPRGGYWDSSLIGPAAPPIEIDAGWLLIYYGEKITSAGPLVRLGAAVLDRDDPSRVLARSNIPILAPRERYERIGDMPNVVFSCGALLHDDYLVVCYGASDSCICLGSAPLDVILQTCSESLSEF